MKRRGFLSAIGGFISGCFVASNAKAVPIETTSEDVISSGTLQKVDVLKKGISVEKVQARMLDFEHEFQNWEKVSEIESQKKKYWLRIWKDAILERRIGIWNAPVCSWNDVLQQYEVNGVLGQKCLVIRSEPDYVVGRFTHTYEQSGLRSLFTASRAETLPVEFEELQIEITDVIDCFGHYITVETTDETAVDRIRAFGEKHKQIFSPHHNNVFPDWQVRFIDPIEQEIGSYKTEPYFLANRKLV